jgi:hypothetical protein
MERRKWIGKESTRINRLYPNKKKRIKCGIGCEGFRCNKLERLMVE